MLDYASIEYINIVYILWELLRDMSRKIPIIPPDNPTWLDNRLLRWDGMSLIRIAVDRVENTVSKLTENELVDELNCHLQYVLLPAQDILKPFQLGDGYYNRLEALYVLEVKNVDKEMFIDVLYIDSTSAFQTVRSWENSRLKDIL